MGNIIPFINPDDKSIKKDDIVVLSSIANSPITAKIRILPHEIHALIRVLFQERKNVEGLYQEAVENRDKKEMEYWKTIQKVIQSLIGKLKSIHQIEEVIKDLSFIELDCLVGIVEEYLHESYLLELQMIEDDTPIITESIQSFYDNVLPLYNKKREEFELI